MHQDVSGLASCIFAGEVVGCLVWGPLSDHWGRKRAYWLSCLLIVLASLASVLAHSFAMLVVARTIVGLGGWVGRP